jgi:hypothetical protein
MCKKKIFYQAGRQLSIPSNPLLASVSDYVAETQSHQGFCAIKTMSSFFFKKPDFVIILAR